MAKKKNNQIESCADIIAFLDNKLVVIERLTEPQGLALVGGRLDLGESLEQCAVREFKEETGLNLKLEGQFKTYSDPKRDPRGQKVSTVFLGNAKGKIKNESGKTIVRLVDLKNFNKFKKYFVFDHGKILKDYLNYKTKNGKVKGNKLRV
jgi:8-oxo-dGTP diphosphatase